MNRITRPISSLYDFRTLDELYRQCFGAASVPTATLQAWWHEYPDGLWGLFNGNQLAGGLSYWPLKPAAYKRFLAGQIREKEFTPSDFESRQPHYYYLSEIALLPQYRGQGLSQWLMDTYFRQAEVISGRMPVTHLALGYSPEGRRLLKNMVMSYSVQPNLCRIDKPCTVECGIKNKRIPQDI